MRESLPLQFQQTDDEIPHLEFQVEVDTGRHVHFYFLLDDFSDLPPCGIATPKSAKQLDVDNLLQSVRESREHAQKQPGFHSGITLFVFFGI